MIVTKFHENRLTIDREISENMRSWLIIFNVTLGIDVLIVQYDTVSIATAQQILDVTSGTVRFWLHRR